MTDPDLATLFSNCLPCTLDTTVMAYTPSTPTSAPDSYVITGDINAQWLRDSTNQVLPYMSLLTADPTLRDLVCGLIHRQSLNIAHDPYANSFNPNASGAGHQDDRRKPKMTAQVFEGKWELDSLAAAMKLAWHYYNTTQDSTCFLQDDTWGQAMKAIIATITTQQQSTLPPGTNDYYFQRETTAPTDSLMLGGVGNTGRRTGMCKSAFRPSDDSSLFPFFVPANAMAVVELRHVGQLLQALASHPQAGTRTAELKGLSDAASTLADELDEGIRMHAIVPVPTWTKAALGLEAEAMMYAYEVDGYGGQAIMDDANIPSLMALPYLGYLNISDPLYQTTRAVLLSPNNPYFFNGSAGEGIGGPHVGLDYIWPMSIITRAMTSTDDAEIRLCLETLKASSEGSGWLHESFNKNNAKDFTRPWFAWSVNVVCTQW
jgi:meiotically up-regulated gene 157 (Mug157) protein